MLLAVLFIIGISIYRGMLNYLTINAILSIGLIIGILMCNSLLLIIGCYGKVGYYPFFLYYFILFHNSSFFYLVLNLLNKIAYFSNIIIVLSFNFYSRCSEVVLVLINLFIVIFFIRIINSIKHIILSSSYLLFIFIYILILINNYLFGIILLLVYIYSNSLLVIKCNFLYVNYVISFQ